MMTDPIADMLTRIRNAVAVERPHVEMPASKVKKGLAEVLKREGYIWDWKEVDQENPTATLRLELKYGPNGERVIQSIRRISKPGRRQEYLRVSLGNTNSGLRATAYPNQSSGVLSSVSNANALAVIPPGLCVEEGDQVIVHPGIQRHGGDDPHAEADEVEEQDVEGDDGAPDARRDQLLDRLRGPAERAERACRSGRRLADPGHVRRQ